MVTVLSLPPMVLCGRRRALSRDAPGNPRDAVHPVAGRLGQSAGSTRAATVLNWWAISAVPSLNSTTVSGPTRCAGLRRRARPGRAGPATARPAGRGSPGRPRRRRTAATSRPSAAAEGELPTGVSAGSDTVGRASARTSKSAGHAAGSAAGLLAAGADDDVARHRDPDQALHEGRPVAAGDSRKPPQPSSRAPIRYPPSDREPGAAAAVAGPAPDAGPEHPAAVQRQRREQVEDGDDAVGDGHLDGDQPEHGVAAPWPRSAGRRHR